MSQKKNKQARAGTGTSPAGKKPGAGTARKGSPATPAPGKKGVLVGIVAALLIGAVVVVSLVTGSGSDGNATAGGLKPSAEEQPYIGRLLPAGYAAPQVSEATTYDSTVEMTELALTSSESSLTVPVAEVTSSKLSLFQYTLPSGEELPLIAYVKPSGALFVGVSFCPPCQGEWQTIQPDGTLTCNSCGTKRDLETMAGISGSCKLYPLDEVPVSTVGEDLVIDRAVLDSWSPQPLDRAVG